jgi:putative ATPase
VGQGGRITPELAAEALQHRFAIYDKSGEEHYNLISALHKSCAEAIPTRPSTGSPACSGAARIPSTWPAAWCAWPWKTSGSPIRRRSSRPMAARDAFAFLGSPEGDLALAQAVVYLATAPKSNRVYRAWKEVGRAAEETASAPVPLHLRNAPTRP